MKLAGTRSIILGLATAVALSSGCPDDPDPSGEHEADASSSGSTGQRTPGSTATTDAPTQTSGSTSASPTSSDDASGSTSGLTTAGSSGNATGLGGTGSTTTGETDGLATQSPGCGQPLLEGWLSDYSLDQGGQTQVAEVQVGGTQRPYIVGLPEDYDPDHAYPVHIVFHALTGTMDHAYGLKVEDRWDEPVIVLAPQGQPYHSGGHSWSWSDAEGPDHQYVQAMIEAVGQHACIDTERVFASGTSNGAYMANAVACVSGLVRGMGASAGGMPISATSCVKPTTAFLMHGTADTVVPLSQGIAARDKWLTINGCSDTSKPAVDDRCDHYSNCQTGAEVYWCVHDGAHPDSNPNSLGFSEPMISIFESL